MSILQQSALVLNRNWQPIHVTCVQRALTLLFGESVRVVDPDDYQIYSWHDWLLVKPDEDEPAVQAVHFRVKAPEVVVLNDYDQLPRAVVTYSKRNVFKRDRFTCQYCGTQPGRDELTIDHVVPRSLGGMSNWENCVLACLNCNHRKANKTPQQAGMRLRRPPERPTWKPLYASLSVVRESWSKFIVESSRDKAIA